MMPVGRRCRRRIATESPVLNGLANVPGSMALLLPLGATGLGARMLGLSEGASRNDVAWC
jgi:hypothetical protein